MRVPITSAAIANNDPPMEYDLCIWGEAHVWTWGARVVCEFIRTLFFHAEPWDEGPFLAHGRRLEVR